MGLIIIHLGQLTGTNNFLTFKQLKECIELMPEQAQEEIASFTVEHNHKKTYIVSGIVTTDDESDATIIGTEMIWGVNDKGEPIFDLEDLD